MKPLSYHFVFSPGTSYKDIAPVFRDILLTVLKENAHFQTSEDEETREMFIQLNLVDLLADRKPEGYNRKGKYRLIFPLDRMEFYIRTFNVKDPEEIRAVGKTIGEMLVSANVKFTVTENDNLGLDE